LAFARLVERLSERHDVSLIAGYRGDRPTLPPGALGVHLGRRGPGWTYHALWRAARSVAQKTEPDLVLTASVDVPFLGHPTVAMVRDLVGDGWRAPTLSDRFYRWRARRFGTVVVPSVSTRDALRATGVDSWRVAVVPEHIDPVAVQGAAEEGVLTLLHAGRLHPGNGQHLSIDAVSRLAPEHKARVRLRVVGAVADRVYADQLRIAVRGQPIDFYTDVDDLRPHFAAAHLVLYPTRVAEGFADTALLAMAHGRPVIWTDHPGVRATTGGIGVAIPPDDVGALRDAIRRFIDDRAGLGALGLASRKRAAEFAWERIRPQWDGVFEVATR
jgi:glycosyltransferase involved in cell wall biosynthesis